MELLVWTLKMLVGKERDVRYRETMYNGTARLMRDMIAFADRHLMADRAMAHVTSLLANKNLATDHFRRLLKQELENLV